MNTKNITLKDLLIELKKQNTAMPKPHFNAIIKMNKKSKTGFTYTLRYNKEEYQKGNITGVE